jgi:hypothetical protein
MTVLADFNTIIHEAPRELRVQPGNPSQLGAAFNTGGRLGEDDPKQTGPLAAFIMFSVLNLKVPLDVFVNDEETGEGPIGTMDPNPDSGWYSQVLCMSGGRLISGDGDNNKISVALPLGSTAGASTFMIKNLICFYHQDSD